MASQETRQMEYEHKKREYADYLRSKAQEVDQQSSITQVLNYYGISFNNSRQCLCPFHQDSKPSMSAERNDKYVHCLLIIKLGTQSISLKITKLKTMVEH